MEDSLTIERNPVPFVAFLAAAGLLGLVLASGGYLYAALLALIFVTLLGWKRSYKFVSGSDSVISREKLFGVVLRKQLLPLSEYRIIRNRIQFNGARLSGNKCVTELVNHVGDVFRVRDESIGFVRDEPHNAREFVNRLSKITSIPEGAVIIENP